MSIPGLLKTGSTLMGSMGKTLANNRGEALGAEQSQQAYDIARASEDRTERDDLWKRLQQADYTLGSTPYQPASIAGYGSLPGFTLPSFGMSGPPPSAATMEGAKALQEEALKRLKGGSTLPRRANLSLTKPGTMENLMGYGSMGLSLANQFLR